MMPRGASAGPAGKGYHEVTGTESCPGDGLFPKSPCPANVRLLVSFPAASLRPVHLAPAVSGLGASPATSGALVLAAPRLLVQLHLPSGGRTLLGDLGSSSAQI